MNLNGRDLTGHLARGLAPVYLVGSEEPLLVAEALDEIRRRARSEGFDERELHVVEPGFRWEELASHSANLSLFATRRIVELRLPSAKPGVVGGKTIRALVENPDPDRLLVIGTTKLDRDVIRCAWVRSIDKHGAVVRLWQIERPELPGWIRRWAARSSLELTPAAAEVLADRVEGNLLAADQEIKKLGLLHGEGRVDEQAVLEAVATNTRFDVYRLTEAVSVGDSSRALKVLDGLRAEGAAPALVLWALAREVSLLARLKTATEAGENEATVMKRNGVWQQRQPSVRKALRRYQREQLTELLVGAADVDSVVKGVVKGSPWDELTRLILVALKPPVSGRTSPWRAA